MEDRLFKKLADVDLLRRAWHLARNDSRTNFIVDSYRWSDFAFRLDGYLEALVEDIESGRYRPRPLQMIDVPKSGLAVRPGAVLAVEDHVVLYAVILLLAPKLDMKLPPSVYSFRLRKKAKRTSLFKEQELIRFPFLKRTTIRRRLEIAEPWYAVWPRFVEQTRIAYEEKGYKFMVVSDISAYFENIDLGLLRDMLLLHLPKEQKIINFLINALEYWTCPTIHGAFLSRGLPQGNDISSFLGNFFLLPLDKIFEAFAKKHNIKYLRYMDDVKVLTKTETTGKEALFEMNDGLRKLHLNIQGAKTIILEGEDIRTQLLDPKFAAVDRIVKQINNKKHITTTEKHTYLSALHQTRKKLRGKRKVIIKVAEFRVFRRLITAYSMLRDPGMVTLTLNQMNRNPDARLTRSAFNYFRHLSSNRTTIARYLRDMLLGDVPLFFYQEAWLISTLRYLKSIPADAFAFARQRLRATKPHWYVRAQAALLLAQKKLTKAELGGLLKDYRKEQEVEVKRAMAMALVQLPLEELVPTVQTMVFSVRPELQRTGRFFHGLLFDEQAGKVGADSLFRNIVDQLMIDRLFEVELLSKSNSPLVRQRLLGHIRRTRVHWRHPRILRRLDAVYAELKNQTNNP